jgi:hypothetical protein
MLDPGAHRGRRASGPLFQQSCDKPDAVNFDPHSFLPDRHAPQYISDELMLPRGLEFWPPHRQILGLLYGCTFAWTVLHSGDASGRCLE